MSLINEALKKAQHQRTGSGLDAPPMPGGGRRGGQSMPTGTLILLAAGAVVVVVISVVATVYFINRAPAPKIVVAPAVAAPAVNPIVSAPSPAPSPVIIAPVIIHAPPATVESPPPAPVVVTAAPVAATVPAPAAATTPAPVATTPSPTTEPVAKPAEAAPAPAAEGSLADRIATFVDKVRVMGIRTTDSGSKVLMNDHVYRLNDVVDRKLGLRLVKIEADSLTFADATGATYVKTF